MSAPDAIAEGLARLEPQDRALLELSSRRGLSDEEIADVLRASPEAVAGRREQALERLAVVLGLGAAGLDELRESLRPGGEPEAEVEPPGGESQPPPPDERSGGRRALAVGALLVAAAVVLALVIAGGDDDEPERQTAARTAPKTVAEAPPPPAQETAPEEEPEPAPAPELDPVQTMEVLNDTNGRGTARLVREGDSVAVRLSVRDFLTPNGGGYAVWLYNSPDDASRLFATQDTDYERDIPLPADYERYRFVEVARAVPNLDSDHSGLSLLRVPISALGG